MATFIAGEDVLHFDFTKFGGPEGDIPEPSSEQITTYLEALRQVMPVTEVNGKVELDLAVLNEKFEANPELISALLNGAVSAVCSGTPTVEEIEALPFRDKQRFYGWIMGTFFPEA